MTKITPENVDEEISRILGEPLKPSVMGGAYEAADRFDRALVTWTPPDRGADADILGDKKLSDARARDIVRNDAYVGSGQTLHKDTVVGAAFRLNARPNTKILGLDETWADEFQQEVEAKFTTWAESYNCWVDRSRRNTFTGLIRLAIGVYLHSGEILATSEWVRAGKRPYRTCFQMIELNRLSNPHDRRVASGNIRGGVELDSGGAPIAYHIRRGELGSFMWERNSDQWTRIRAETSFGRPNVIHILEQHRPGQSRGVSQLVTALKEMRTTKRFRDVVLQNAVVNASFAASIESELPPQTVFEAMGSGNAGQTIADYATEYLGAVNAYAGNARNMQIDGVKIPHFFPGTKLNMMPMGTPGGVGSDFETSLLRYLAASLDVSYEEMARDYSKTNYSSARAGMLVTWRSAQSRKKMVAERLAQIIYRNWFEEAAETGELETMRGRPSLYDGLNIEAYTACSWIGAARGMIDELKETQASVQRLRNGLSTFEEEHARQGRDWREVFAQLKKEKLEMERLGLEFDGGEAENATTGAPRDDDGENNARED